jgi:hypothetical protein
MAHHNNTPMSVLTAPTLMWAWAQDDEGNQIKFEGVNRAQRRAAGDWGSNRLGRRGFSEPSLSSRKTTFDE